MCNTTQILVRAGALLLLRLKLLILIGLLTGHADPNRQLFIVKVSGDKLCLYCQEVEESAVHFLAKFATASRVLTSWAVNFGLCCLDYNELSRMR